MHDPRFNLIILGENDQIKLNDDKIGHFSFLAEVEEGWHTISNSCNLCATYFSFFGVG